MYRHEGSSSRQVISFAPVRCDDGERLRSGGLAGDNGGGLVSIADRRRRVTRGDGWHGATRDSEGTGDSGEKLHFMIEQQGPDNRRLAKQNRILKPGPGAKSQGSSSNRILYQIVVEASFEAPINCDSGPTMPIDGTRALYAPPYPPRLNLSPERSASTTALFVIKGRQDVGPRLGRIAIP